MSTALHAVGLSTWAPDHNQCVRKVLQLGQYAVGPNIVVTREDVERVVLANRGASPLDCCMVVKYFLQQPNGVVPHDQHLLVSEKKPK